MPMTWMLILAMTLGCTQPASTSRSGSTHRDGSYKLPKNHDQIDAFVAMDEAFHEYLGALVSSSRANDLPRTCCSDGVQAVAASYASGAHVSARSLTTSEGS